MGFAAPHRTDNAMKELESLSILEKAIHLARVAWFQALADVYPDDIEARHRLLRDTIHTADGFIRNDSHDVPFWALGDPSVEFRPIRLGDRGNLWTWLDWMASSSSNAAASTIMAQALVRK